MKNEKLLPCPCCGVDSWIDVSDRLPEKSEWVIGFTIFDGILFHIKQEEGEWYTMSTPWTGTKVNAQYIIAINKAKKIKGSKYRGKVTHWMPLPQPPTDRTNEGII